MRRLSFVASLLACAACASEYHPEYHPVSSYTMNQSVSYPTIYEVAGAAPPVAPPVYGSPAVTSSPRPPSVTGRDPSHVVVIESSHLDRPGEVIGVVDVEDPVGTHDSGIDLLKRRAAEMGADAVVSVEFHKGQTAHVSGLAMRFVRALPGPSHG